MPLVVLNFKITDFITVQFSRSHQNKAAKNALLAAGDYWHSVIMEEHFTPGKQSRYAFAARTEVYRRIVKKIEGVGQGKFADLQKKGTSFRFAKFFSKVSATSRRAVVRVNVPAYFSKRSVGVVYEDGKRKTIRNQPDLAAELTRTANEDIRRVDRRATDVYRAHFGSGQLRKNEIGPLPPPRTVFI